jgi:hypothetical protein
MRGDALLCTLGVCVEGKKWVGKAREQEGNGMRCAVSPASAGSSLLSRRLKLFHQTGTLNVSPRLTRKTTYE